MSEVQVKTNIMCAACIEKVTPVFNENFGSENWKVDTTSPKKILTVSNATEAEVIDAVSQAGYKAEQL